MNYTTSQKSTKSTLAMKLSPVCITEMWETESERGGQWELSFTPGGLPQYACPNHTDDSDDTDHSDHGYLDTCDNPLGSP